MTKFPFSQERFHRFYSNQNLIARILFVLLALSALMMCVSLFHITFIYITLLLGLIWFFIRLIPKREKRSGRLNRFTKPVILCAVLSLGCFVFTMFYKPIYPEAEEFLNQQCRLIQENLNDPNESKEEIISTIRYNFQVRNPLGDVNHNYVITDAEHHVLYAHTSWKTGGEEQLRALICPSPMGGENRSKHLMLLINERGDVVSTFRISRDWIKSAAGNPYKSLTISDESAAQESDESADPFFDRYFPSFGAIIDSCTSSLKDAMILYDSTQGYGFEQTDVQEWNRQPISSIGFLYSDSATEAQVIAELTTLTDEELTELRNHLTWLDRAEASIYPEGDPNSASEARILTSSDGELTVYVLYEYNYEALNPRRVNSAAQIRIRHYVLMVAYMLIPVVIVLLAFWVFVDAKRRGHKFPALWAVLTLIGNGIAWIIYMMVRPAASVSAEGRVIPMGVCAECGMKLRSDFIVCPGCGASVRSKCTQCGRVIEPDWNFCPYCAAQVKIDSGKDSSINRSAQDDESTQSADADNSL